MLTLQPACLPFLRPLYSLLANRATERSNAMNAMSNNVCARHPSARSGHSRHWSGSQFSGRGIGHVRSNTAESQLSQTKPTSPKHVDMRWRDGKYEYAPARPLRGNQIIDPLRSHQYRGDTHELEAAPYRNSQFSMTSSQEEESFQIMKDPERALPRQGQNRRGEGQGHIWE